MNKEFIPYEQALGLKELGFDEEVLGWYNTDKNFIIPLGKEWITIDTKHPKRNSDFNYKGALDFIAAPLFQQAFRWFREKYPDFDFGVGKIYNGSNTYHYHINLSWEYFEGTYEEAELACLIKLIELVKQ